MMSPNKEKKPGQKSGRTGARAISGAESDLWNQVMGAVEPLGDIGADFVPGQVPENEQPENEQPGNPAPGKKKQPAMAPRPSPPPRPPLSVPGGQKKEPEFVHGKAPGLDRRSQTKMRRGQVEIEARLDLHGMTQDEAHRALSGFLETSRAAGRRAVLVITGKGRGPDGSGEGVLRAAVPKWLNEASVREMIKGFSYAAPKHGGQGALYILLKRQK